MKLKTYKSIGFLIAAFFISGLQAQKFDKKYNETFKVNKDVLVQINASNADINVTTWNRNEVAVEAIITVEGLSKRDAQEFYAIHKERPFFGELVEFMTRGPIVAAILEKDNAVDDFRALIGATNPAEAAEGTIRKLYATSIGENAVHGSDSDENAQIEGDFHFSADERF